MVTVIKTIAITLAAGLCLALGYVGFFMKLVNPDFDAGGDKMLKSLLLKEFKKNGIHTSKYWSREVWAGIQFPQPTNYPSTKRVVGTWANSDGEPEWGRAYLDLTSRYSPTCVHMQVNPQWVLSPTTGMEAKEKIAATLAKQAAKAWGTDYGVRGCLH